MNSDIVKVAFIFVLVYGALFALSFLEPLQTWNFTLDFGKLDYTLFLLPIPGFFFIYSLIPWMRQELGFGRMFIMAFPILLIIFSLLLLRLQYFTFTAIRLRLQVLTFQHLILIIYRFSLEVLSFTLCLQEWAVGVPGFL